MTGIFMEKLMRTAKSILLITISVLGLSLLLSAGQNQFGVANVRNVSFDAPIHVGASLLPAGEYQVLHTMSGTDHVMVFKQLNGKTPVEAKVNCTLVRLNAKAEQSQKIYQLNEKNERVLQELVFRGDTAKHVF